MSTREGKRRFSPFMGRRVLQSGASDHRKERRDNTDQHGTCVMGNGVDLLVQRLQLMSNLACSHRAHPLAEFSDARYDADFQEVLDKI